MEPLTITPREAAQLSGWGLEDIYAGIHCGKIPHIRVGRTGRLYRIHRDLFLDLVKQDALDNARVRRGGRPVGGAS